MRNALHWLQGCIGLKLVLRTVANPFTMKPRSSWVYEDSGSKGRSTNSAVERSALGSSEDPFSFKTGLGEIRGLRTNPVGFLAVSE